MTPPPKQQLTLADVIYIGFNRRVAALNRRTGEIVWQWISPCGSGYVSLLLERDLLVVSVDGYIFGLNPFSGEELWRNPMKGFGTGVTTLVSLNGTSGANLTAAAADSTAKQAQQQHQALQHQQVTGWQGGTPHGS